MEKTSLRRFGVWGLLALPLLAVVLVALTLAWGNSSAPETEAAGGVDLSVSSASCTAGKCEVAADSQFTVSVSVDDISGLPDTDTDTTNGYTGVQANFDYSAAGLTFVSADTSPWPDCLFAAAPSDSGTVVFGGCAANTGVESTYIGTVIDFTFQCGSTVSSGPLVLQHGTVLKSHVLDDLGSQTPDKGADEVLTVNCNVRPTETNTPELSKDTTLSDESPTKVFRDGSVDFSGSANYAQDLDGDTVAGWGGGQIAMSVAPSGPVIKQVSGGGPADALCAPVDVVTFGCIADTLDLTPPDEATGPIDISGTVNCNDSIGDFVLTATSSFFREDGSPVPANKSITNTATLDFTCNPREIQVQKLPVLQNEFLEAQGAKLPPINCQSSDDVAEFSEELSLPVETTFAKPLEGPYDQELAGFEFEVRFDPKLVCVNIIPGTAAANMVCIIRDKDEGMALTGIAQIGCATKKGQDFPDTSTNNQLATLEVRPQPELYSQIIANQDNGIVAQILNQDCNLTDQNGHPIPILSCEDADITFRYLEADVDGDCDVDAADQQALSFRWGVGLGSLLYNSRLDLQPSGVVKGDGEINIKDLQFVFGRHGSTCAAPNPDQPPANPKGGL